VVRSLVAALAALVVTGCAGSSAPLIAPPVKIDSFCTGSNMAPRATALASIMTSTDDKPLAQRPDFAAIQRQMRTSSGAIGHWNDQLLALPNTSKALGERDGFARVEALAVPAAAPGAANRVVYFLFRDDHGASRWVALTAFDVQNVCIAGHPQA